MDQIKSFLQVRKKIEREFYGLPHFHFCIVCTLLTHVDIDTGSVEGLSYKDLSSILEVRFATGRKNTGSPTKQSLRNAITTIERVCGDHFEVITEGQNLKFQFPQLPKMLKDALENTEVNTEDFQEKIIYHTENKEKKSTWHDELNTDFNKEVNTPKSPVKNIFILNKNNKQQQTTTAMKAKHDLAKKPISEKFYPSSDTLARAMALGYTTADDPIEIHNFILFNQSIGSNWADFNPIYLRWLEEGKNRIRQKQLRQTRSSDDATSSSKAHKNSVIERVRKAWINEGLEFCQITNRLYEPQSHYEQREDCDFVASA